MSRNNEDVPAINVDEERRLSLRDAVVQAQNGLLTRPAFDKRRRKAFIELLAAGLTASQACRQVGISAVYVAKLRRDDPTFDDAVMTAIEIGTDPIVERFTAIALHGEPTSMATVRAGEVVLKGRNAAYRDKGGSVRLERRHPDGTVDRISAGSNGIPD